MKHIFSVLLIFLSFISSIQAQDVFHGCGMQGDAQHAKEKTLNELKDRYNFPAKADFTSTTLADILAPGKDANRFSSSDAVEIEGYVFDVKPGGSETCNCHKTDDALIDTHIEIAISSSKTKKTQLMIVEVTPRIREIMKNKGIDWSTSALYGIIGKTVKIQGWLMFDAMHTGNAKNTNPKGKKNWRATCWEIHPVTSIEVIK